MLKIKTGSVVRLKRELGLYETEKVSEEQRVARMKAQGADIHDIKHAVGSTSMTLHMHVWGRQAGWDGCDLQLKIASCVFGPLRYLIRRVGERLGRIQDHDPGH